LAMPNLTDNRPRSFQVSDQVLAITFLPPYSPDYNPIEKIWTDMKRSLGNNLQDFKSVASAVYDYFSVSDI
jgi:transposase